MTREWQRKRLGELCEVIAGQSPDGKSYNTEGDGMIFPRISGHRVKGHTMIWNEVLDDEEAKRV